MCCFCRSGVKTNHLAGMEYDCRIELSVSVLRSEESVDESDIDDLSETITSGEERLEILGAKYPTGTRSRSTGKTPIGGDGRSLMTREILEVLGNSDVLQIVAGIASKSR